MLLVEEEHNRRVVPYRTLCYHTLRYRSRVFAMYQVLLGWKTYKYYSEYKTGKLPNPRSTQPKKKRVKSGQVGLKVASGPLFPTANVFFLGWD